MTRQIEPELRDDVEGDIGDDPFHVNKGVTHYDTDDEIDSAPAGSAAVTIERSDFSQQPKAVTTAVTVESGSHDALSSSSSAVSDDVPPNVTIADIADEED